MDGFVDETTIEVESGHGGSGAVSFHREKFVPKGGPDGGDGGKGGDVVFFLRNNLRTLAHLKMLRHFRAENGGPGMGKRKHGKDGKDVLIPVPPGTILKYPDSDEIIYDFTEQDSQLVFSRGGKGGKGNWHFATSTRQAPRYAQPGLPGSSAVIRVELSIIADIGFVGFPNAGKSTLLSILTNAHPKIADYAFTTKIPNLGVMNLGYTDIILADIPGIIEGASHGAGLGFKFLRHISRTRGLAFLIDLSSPGYLEAFPTLLDELGSYAPDLVKKKRIVLGTKLDMPETLDCLRSLAESLPGETVLGVSAHTRQGIGDLSGEFKRLVEEL
ncbi:MAG: GTPase ObgE [Spirochaetales bacterium]|nr:MAG: GTPase ObgE [Spirochaetales bacterium]